MVFTMTRVFSWETSVNLYPASFCTPLPNLSFILGIFWLSTFAFQSLMMKRTSFLMFVLEDVIGLHEWINFSFLVSVVGTQTWVTVMFKGFPWKQTDYSSLLRLHPSTEILLLTMRDTSFLLRGFLPIVVDIMVIWVKFAQSHPFYFADVLDIDVYSHHILLDDVQFTLTHGSNIPGF